MVVRYRLGSGGCVIDEGKGRHFRSQMYMNLYTIWQLYIKILGQCYDKNVDFIFHQVIMVVCRSIISFNLD